MKKNKKRNSPPPTALPPETDGGTAIDKKALTRMLLIHAVLIIALYFLIAALGFAYISAVYLVAGTLLAVGYLIYNKGFVYRGVTKDQLTGNLSDAEKEALLKEMRERDVRSKWILTLLLPIVIALLLDTLYLYVLPSLEGWFS